MNKVRIIGGMWRGRKLEFPALAAIRPSPDRVRETVFNWLQNDIAGARCLDLFAGSGALGFESLSRGAAHVTFIDREPVIARYLKDALQRLNAGGHEVHALDAEKFLTRAPLPFDIVFLDPPFGARMLSTICQQLNEGWLTANAYVYLENAAEDGAPKLPIDWQLMKTKTAGQVGYHLARCMSVPTK